MISSANPAPIGLFVYNRPEHTRLTVEALAKNPEAAGSRLFIFSDGPKNNSHRSSVEAVRDYLRHIDGFLEVNIIERESNWGLADSIIDGVTQLCHQFGRVIVVEDDLVTSPAFLGFMNRALDIYEQQNSVWHISGWNYPIDCNEVNTTFLWQTMNCWGWATWQDRWVHFTKDPAGLITHWSAEDIRRFNLDGAYNFWKQVVLNQKGKLNTWAIFWYATIFERGGLCLNPCHSYVTNIGHDGSGQNCRKSNLFLEHGELNQIVAERLESTLTESTIHVEKIKALLAKEFSLYARLKRRIFP